MRFLIKKLIFVKFKNENVELLKFLVIKGYKFFSSLDWEII